MLGSGGWAALSPMHIRVVALMRIRGHDSTMWPYYSAGYIALNPLCCPDVVGICGQAASPQRGIQSQHPMTAFAAFILGNNTVYTVLNQWANPPSHVYGAFTLVPSMRSDRAADVCPAALAALQAFGWCVGLGRRDLLHRNH